MSTTLPAIDQLELWNIKRQVLECKRKLLCDNLAANKHYPYLRSVEILTKNDQDLIDSGVTTLDRNGKFIDILLTKGPRAFDELCNSIADDRTQIFLLEELNRQLELIIHQKRSRPTYVNTMANYLIDDDSLPNPGEPEGPEIPSDSEFMNSQSGRSSLLNGLDQPDGSGGDEKVQ